MVIDFHTHCFPDKLAPRALSQLSYASGGMTPHSDGTMNGLINSMKECGVDTSVVLGIATNAHQQHSVNDFAASINNGVSIVAFGSVFPDADDALDELERIKAMGLKGVKFHPEYQGFYVDDEKMKPIYKKISSLGLITVFHAGFDYGYPAPYHCMPDNLLNALKWFESPVVAAHWGGQDCGEKVIELLCGRDLYFDTSFGCGTMPRPVAMRIAEKHGVDKLLFGTDLPWHTATMEKNLLETLELSDAEKNKIYCDNAKKLLNL